MLRENAPLNSLISLNSLCDNLLVWLAISCQKGLDMASIKRKSRWVVLGVFPIRALDWKVADDPLSQEISSLQVLQKKTADTTLGKNPDDG